MKICDLHCDTVLKLRSGQDISADDGENQITIDKLKAGNVAVQVFACFVPSVIPQRLAFREAMELLSFIEIMSDLYKDDLAKTHSLSQLQDNFDRNIISVIPAIENGYVIENDLTKLEKLREKGVLYMTLTHSHNLDWAASSAEKQCDFEGLTSFGKKVIEAMNEIGMIIDVSHVHQSTLKSVAKISKKPFIASHSCVSKICSTPRNLSDDDIKMIADSGGMIGINFFPAFLDKNYAEYFAQECGDIFKQLDKVELNYYNDPVKKYKKLNKLNAQIAEKMYQFRVNMSKIVDHIEYICNLVGDDFVGFGSDFDGIPDLPAGVKGSDCYPQLVNLLQNKGFTKESISKITSKNAFRIIESSV